MQAPGLPQETMQYVAHVVLSHAQTLLLHMNPLAQSLFVLQHVLSLHMHMLPDFK